MLGRSRMEYKISFNSFNIDIAVESSSGADSASKPHGFWKHSKMQNLRLFFEKLAAQRKLDPLNAQNLINQFFQWLILVLSFKLLPLFLMKLLISIVNFFFKIYIINNPPIKFHFRIINFFFLKI